MGFCNLFDNSFTIFCFQTEDLVKNLYNLENSPSSDAAVRERIAALPQEVADHTCLEKLKGLEFSSIV